MPSGRLEPVPSPDAQAWQALVTGVRDYLGLSSSGRCDWRFVDVSEVPAGPWRNWGTNNPFVQRQQADQAAQKTEIGNRLEELRKMRKAFDKTGKLTKDGEKKWAKTATALARAIRLAPQRVANMALLNGVSGQIYESVMNLGFVDKVAPPVLRALGKQSRLVEAVVRQAVTAAMSLSDADVAKIMSEVQTKLARPDAPQKEIFSYDYDAGIVTVNEARATKGLGPIPNGDMPVLEWMQRFKPAAPSQQQPAGNA